MPQMYGDFILFKQLPGEDVRYHFQSLSDDRLVTISMPAVDCVEESSLLQPVIYTCCQEDNNEYSIYAINCSTITSEKIYTNQLKVQVDDDGQGIDSIELIENEHSSFLRISQLGTDTSAVEIFDIHKRKVIFSQSYSDADPDHPTKEGEYSQQAWTTLRYNIDTPYYATTSGEYGVVTVANIHDPFYDVDKSDIDADETDENILPDKPAYFSKYYPEFYISDCRWVNSDILTFKLSRNPRQVFFSVAKRREIGHIDADLEAIYVNRNNVIAFTRKDEIYVIKLNLSYVQQDTNNKKRKLSDGDEDDQSRKKQKYDANEEQ